MAFSHQIFLAGLLTILTLSVFVTFSIPLSMPDYLNGSDTFDRKCNSTKEFYHNETQKCYREKSKVPCSGNLVFLSVNQVFGDCDCSVNGYLPWVYHPETNQCYKSYQQSYCAPGEWLIFNMMNEPICSPNPCINEVQDDNNPAVLFNNQCVLLNKSSKLCDDSNDIIKFNPTSVIPECGPNVSEFSVATTQKLKCRPGTRRSGNGTCRRTTTVISADE